MLPCIPCDGDDDGGFNTCAPLQAGDNFCMVAEAMLAVWKIKTIKSQY